MPVRTFVACRVSPGFFTSEYYVVLKDGSAYVVDRDNVRVSQAPEKTSDVDGKVLAYVVEEGPQGTLIEMPGEPVNGGLRTWVSKDELEYLSAA